MKYDLTLSEHNAPRKLAGGVANTAVFTRQVPGPQARPTLSCALITSFQTFFHHKNGIIYGILVSI